MSREMNPETDLMVERVIRAPVDAVWRAWTEPARFERWWVPAPSRTRVLTMELQPGGAFETEISENGAPFGPHMRGCFLAVEHRARIVFTNALLGGWRPAVEPFMTAIISFAEHPDGTHYVARAMHKDGADKAMHAELGFHDGWGTVTRQLAELVERGA